MKSSDDSSVSSDQTYLVSLKRIFNGDFSLVEKDLLVRGVFERRDHRILTPNYTLALNILLQGYEAKIHRIATNVAMKFFSREKFVIDMSIQDLDSCSVDELCSRHFIENTHIIEDLAQEGRIALYDLVERLDIGNVENVVEYLSTSVKNALIKYLESEYRSGDKTIGVEFDEISYTDDCEESIIDQIKITYSEFLGLFEILKRRSPRSAQVIGLKYGINCEPIDNEEIAQQLGIKVSSVRAFISKGKFFLQCQIKR